MEDQYGVSAEVIDLCSLSPVDWVAATDTFVAYAPDLEEVILPQVESLKRAMIEVAAF
jgi:pyruvate/2-oxoglutarate/acetoin dehydrogenase E1 component